MSDESSNTNAQAGLAEIGDAVDNAVAGSSQEASEQTENTGSQEPAKVAAEAKATLKDPKASKTEKKIAEKQLKKLRIKVDGQEEDVEYDPNDENFIREQLQLAKVSRKRMQEKAVIEKEVLQFIEDLRKNPKKALSDPAIGMDLKKFAVQIMEEEIENSKKSPQQLEKEALELELRELKEQREKEKTDFESKERERLTEQEFERLDIQMSQALEKNSFPKNPAVIKRMADYMLIGLEAGKDVTPEDIVPLIREDLQNDYKDILNSMPDDDALEEFIGKEFVDRIRRKNIAKAKKANSNPAVKAAGKTPSTGNKEESKETEEKKQTIKQMFGV